MIPTSVPIPDPNLNRNHTRRLNSTASAKAPAVAKASSHITSKDCQESKVHDSAIAPTRRSQANAWRTLLCVNLLRAD